MEESKRPRGSRLVLVVMGSAAGLIALGVVSLWRSLRDADAAARTESQRAAIATAQAVRGVLADAATLDRFPDEVRFEVGADGPVVTEGVLPISDDTASYAVAALLERAQGLEFQDGRPEEALRLLDGEAARATTSPSERDTIELAAAWIAERRDDAPGSGVRVRAIAERWVSLPPSLVASAVLLFARSGLPIPQDAGMRLTRLHTRTAEGTLARLGELGVGGESLARIERAVTSMATRRSVLEHVAKIAPVLQQARQPQLSSLADRVLVYHPIGRDRGRGALVDRAELLDVLRDEALAIPWSGEPVFDDSRPDHVEVFAGLSIRPAAPKDLGIWANPGAVWGLLVALGASFGLGLFSLLRSLRSERAALTVRSEFLSSVTHELKTPLSSIRMFAELLEEGRVPEQRKPHYYQLLASESSRLTALVENVLDLRRMESGQRSYDKRRLDVAALIEQTLDVFAPVAERSDLEVRNEAGDAVWVDGDRAALQQALLNLLDNASKYAAGGKHVRVSVQPNGRQVHVRVCDAGPGVPERERVQIFERFRRGAAQSAGTIPGVGLGLYLSREIARAHGGDLTCDVADSSEGACFSLRLPLPEEGRA